MAMIERLNSPNEDIEALLPWYEKGTLSHKEARMVEAYLESNPDRARFLALIREEAMETVEANERAGMPSRAAFDKLMDAVAAEPKPVRTLVRQRAGGLMARLFGQSASPWLVAGVAAACLVIIVQAATLGVLLMRGDPSGPNGFKLVGDDKITRPVETGTFVFVGFKPTTTASEMSSMLQSLNATIVDGPKSGNVYTLKVSSEKLTGERLDEIVQKIRARSDIIGNAIPKTAR
jgi:hypothetical protein